MSRKMSDPEYRRQQWEHRYDAHVAPFNRFVDELGHQSDVGHPPYVAPLYKGVECRGLVVLRDPGPRAGGDQGSGFLSVENDDDTAERQFRFMTLAGVDPANMLPWNAYPWYINAKPNSQQIRDGTAPLRRVIEMLPRLRVILLLGGDAKRAWKVFLRGNGDFVRDRDVQVLESYHTGRQALFHPDRGVRASREESIRDAFVKAASLMM